MKYAIILPDGAADEPIPELGDRTPLEAARKPNMDRIARRGRLGLVQTIPADLAPASDVATLSLLGYDPGKCYTGRAPLEAAARGIDLAENDVAVRCNLVTIANGVMLDHSAGNISNDEGRRICADLAKRLGSEQFQFVPGVSYRHLLICRNCSLDVTTTPPHDIVNQPIERYLPRGSGSEILLDLMARAKIQKGQHAATGIWLWGEGKKPELKTFAERFGVRGAVIGAVDLIRGIGTVLGWDRIDVPGATGFVNTNYAGKGAAAVKALSDHDLVVVHVEAPDEAGHQGNARDKITAIERIDARVVGPVLEALHGFDRWRILIAPDHPTPCRCRTHTADPVPFAMAGEGIEPFACRKRSDFSFTESSARAAGEVVSPGHVLMGQFIQNETPNVRDPR